MNLRLTYAREMLKFLVIIILKIDLKTLLRYYVKLNNVNLA